MSKNYFLLPAPRKRKIRGVAREVLLLHPDDCNAACLEAETRLRNKQNMEVFSDEELTQLSSDLAGSVVFAFFLNLAVSLALELIKYWFEQNDKSPPETYQPGEPAGDDL